MKRKYWKSWALAFCLLSTFAWGDDSDYSPSSRKSVKQKQEIVYYSNNEETPISQYQFDNLPNSPNALTYEKLKDFIKEKKIRTINTLLRHLSEHPTHRRLLEKPVLMHQSRSAQELGVTYLKPRIIAFRDRLILGITGNSEEPSTYNMLEIIEYNPGVQQWEFHRIDFEDRKVRYNDRPENCSGCHLGRPLWESYNFWPGAYGTIFDEFPREHPETLAYVDFYKNQAGRGRYVYFKKHFPKPRWNGVFYQVDKTSANFQFSNFVSRLNQRIQYAKIKEMENYKNDKILLPLLGAFLACEPENAFPGRMLETLEKKVGKTFRQIKKEHADELKHSVKLREERYLEIIQELTKALNLPEGNHEHTTNLERFDDSHRTAMVRLLLESEGFDFQSWSAFRNGPSETSYTFTSGGYGLGDMMMHDFGADFYTRFPKLWRSDPIPSFYRVDPLIFGTNLPCYELKEMILKSPGYASDYSDAGSN